MTKTKNTSAICKDSDELCDALHDLCSDSVEWEDQGIGSYEFWGARGNDVNWQPCLQVSDMTVDVNEWESDDIPFRFSLNVSGGGCDGEHGGPCRGRCTEWEIKVSATLSEIKLVQMPNGTYGDGSPRTKAHKIAVYDLEQD